MDRITGAWEQLGRRERVLAAIAAVSLLLAVAFVLLSGGDEVVPIDASTTAADQAAGPVKPTPGMIVSNSVPPPAAPGAPTPTGVAPLAISGESELPDEPLADAEGARLEAEARESWKPVPARKGPVRRPAVSASIRATGQVLEQVAKDFRACIAAKGKGDKRGCVRVLRQGVSVDSPFHDNGAGVTFAARSSDGHKLTLTVIDGVACRALDGGRSCDAW